MLHVQGRVLPVKVIVAQEMLPEFWCKAQEEASQMSLISVHWWDKNL